MEAMWTRFQPAIVRTRELLADGAIGTIRGVQADLGVPRAYDPSDRLFAPELGGGAMLDLGVYVVSFAQMVLGTPDSVQARGFLTPDGVDATASLLLSFPQQATATLMISLHSVMPGAARIFGDAGWIDVPPRFHHPTSVVLHRPDHESETMYLPPIGAGYAHELIEATESVQAGRTESAVMPLDDTLAAQRILETALTQLGVQYAEDPTALD
jgi:predicted dehydrogenase